MQSEDGDNFQQLLWNQWRDEESRLNWSQFDFDGVPGSNYDCHQKWHNTDQEWVLEDSNKFYYPLFGLGTSDTSTVTNDGLIMIVGLGPAHNTDWIWGNGFSDEGWREGIEGPPANADAWEVISDSAYLESFDRQKQIWNEVRADTYSSGGHKLFKNITELSNELFATNTNPFEEFYITNFLKDGEWNPDSDGHVNLSFEELPDSWQTACNSSGNIQYDDPEMNLFEPNRWRDLDHSSGEKSHIFAEHAAREFWLPILAKEIDAVDPNLVIPCGNKTVDAIYQLFKNEKTAGSQDIGEVLSDGNHVKRISDIEGEYIKTQRDLPDLLPSTHWGRGGMNPTNLANTIKSKASYL